MDDDMDVILAHTEYLALKNSIVDKEKLNVQLARQLDALLQSKASETSKEEKLLKQINLKDSRIKVLSLEVLKLSEKILADEAHTELEDTMRQYRQTLIKVKELSVNQRPDQNYLLKDQEIFSLRNQRQNFLRQIKEFDQIRQTLERQLKKSRNQSTILRDNQIQSLKSERQTLIKQVKLSDQKKSKLEKQLNNLRNQSTAYLRTKEEFVIKTKKASEQFQNLLKKSQSNELTYKRQIESHQNGKSELERKIIHLEKSKQALERDKNTLESHLKDKTNKIKVLQELNASIKDKMHQLETNLSQRQIDLLVQKQEIALLTNQKMQIEYENITLHSKTMEIQDTMMKTINLEKDGLKANLMTWQQEKLKMTQQIQRLVKEQSMARENLKKERIQRSSSEYPAEAKILELTKKLESLQKENKSLKQGMNDLEKKYKNVLAESEANRNTLIAKLKNVEDEKAIVLVQNTTLSVRINELIHLAEFLEEQNKKSQRKVRRLDDLEIRFADYKNKGQKLLKNKLRQFIWSITEHINTNKGLNFMESDKDFTNKKHIELFDFISEFIISRVQECILPQDIEKVVINPHELNAFR